jgi:hypothetical protein
MEADENRSSSNLLLLCMPHADRIDLLENVGSYPVAELREWKTRQLAAFDTAAGEAWKLSDDEVEQVLEASAHVSTVVRGHTIIVGGTGGSAPGASGGGGGAIGPGAIGGPGGPIEQTDLDGTEAQAPGAGGGGGGVIAPGAFAPDTSASASATEGRGFSTGLDGHDGGDSTVSIGDKILLRARGGKAGLAGTGVRLSTDKLAVSAMMLADFVKVESGGLASLIGGGWQSTSVLNVPTPATFPLIIMFEAGGVMAGEYTAGVELREPGAPARRRDCAHRDRIAQSFAIVDELAPPEGHRDHPGDHRAA